jgi:serine/threonine-protein kinase
MSPEQLLGEPLDARSDVYSLALIAFVLLTGEHAFTGVSEQAEMMARITVPPRTLTEIRPQEQWPADLLRLFERTLSKKPMDRPATASQFATAMLNAVQGDARIAASAANAPVASSNASRMHR